MAPIPIPFIISSKGPVESIIATLGLWGGIVLFLILLAVPILYLVRLEAEFRFNLGDLKFIIAIVYAITSEIFLWFLQDYLIAFVFASIIIAMLIIIILYLIERKFPHAFVPEQPLNSYYIPPVGPSAPARPAVITIRKDDAVVVEERPVPPAGTWKVVPAAPGSAAFPAGGSPGAASGTDRGRAGGTGSASDTAGGTARDTGSGTASGMPGSGVGAAADGLPHNIRCVLSLKRYKVYDYFVLASLVSGLLLLLVIFGMSIFFLWFLLFLAAAGLTGVFVLLGGAIEKTYRYIDKIYITDAGIALMDYQGKIAFAVPFAGIRDLRSWNHEHALAPAPASGSAVPDSLRFELAGGGHFFIDPHLLTEPDRKKLVEFLPALAQMIRGG